MAAEPLRILVAEARPLVLASQVWEADLGELALAFPQQGGAPIAARPHLEEGVALYRNLATRLPNAYRRKLIIVLLNLARVCAALGNEEPFRAALAEAWELGWRPDVESPESRVPGPEAGETPALPGEPAHGPRATADP